MLGLLARGFAVKLIRLAATGASVALVASAVGRRMDPCGDVFNAVAIITLTAAPAAISFIFATPRPSMLRFIDNCVIACIASPIALTAAIDHYGEECGSELIAGVVLVNGLSLAMIGAVLGALGLHLYLRKHRTASR